MAFSVCNIRGATIKSYQSCRKDLILLTEHKTKVSTFFHASPAREKGYELSEGFREYLRQHHVGDLPHYLVRTRTGQLALMNNRQSSILALFLAVYDRYESQGLRLLVDSNLQGWAEPIDASWRTRWYESLK